MRVVLNSKLKTQNSKLKGQRAKGKGQRAKGKRTADAPSISLTHFSGSFFEF
jgi:hypothetical protein